ncbi:MAG: DUF302 domain-containing protein, partial [Magnetococcales bacterium]|nr:DUF302 domain-containing protein [Magnetococcales bacterium]
MGLIKNLLALIGLVAMIAGGYAYSKIAPKMAGFDSKYMETYTDFADRLLSTGDPGTAMVVTLPVNEDLTADDVIESLKSLAADKDMLY